MEQDKPKKIKKRDVSFDHLTEQDCKYICSNLIGIPQYIGTTEEELPVMLFEDKKTKKTDVIRYLTEESVPDYMDRCQWLFKQKFNDKDWYPHEAPVNKRMVVHVYLYDPWVRGATGEMLVTMRTYDFQSMYPIDGDPWYPRFQPIFDHFIAPLAKFIAGGDDIVNEVRQNETEEIIKIRELWDILGGTTETWYPGDSASRVHSENWNWEGSEYFAREYDKFLSYCEGKYGIEKVEEWKRLSKEADNILYEKGSEEEEEEEEEDEHDPDDDWPYDDSDDWDDLDEMPDLPEDVEDLIDEAKRRKYQVMKRMVSTITKEPEKKEFLQHLMQWNSKFECARKRIKDFIEGCVYSPEDSTVEITIDGVKKSMTEISDELFNELISFLPHNKKDDEEKKKDEADEEEVWTITFKETDEGWKHRILTITNGKGELVWKEQLDIEGLMWRSNAVLYQMYPFPEWIKELLCSTTCADLIGCLLANNDELKGNRKVILKWIREYNEHNSDLLYSDRNHHFRE